MIKCPNCGIDFNEQTGRRPKKFCSDDCKVKFWNGKKKVQVQDLTKPTKTNEVKPPETSTNVTVDTIPKMPLGYGHPIADQIEMDEWRNEIKAKIAEIKAEKIPPLRDTLWGRKSWNSEQKQRIAELEKQLYK